MPSVRINAATLTFLTFALSHSLALTTPSNNLSKKHTSGGGIHLPIRRQEKPRLHKRSPAQTSAAGLGDYVDVTYSVLLTVGNTETPVVLDTGSSDLWFISDACVNCTTSVPLYPQATFQSNGLDARLLYGDSSTGTHAFGLVGTDSVSIAGLSLQNQCFAAINNTNTSVLETGSAGIFGLGFPIGSVIWNEVFNDWYSKPAPQAKRDVDRHERKTSSTNLIYNLATRFFPDFHFPRLHSTSPFPTSLTRPNAHNHQPRQQPTSLIPSILASYTTIGPLVARLVSLGALATPMFTVTLQRDTVDIGGNVGLLSLGEFPDKVHNENLTWVDVRRYPTSQGGLGAPADSPNEVYPIAWEIPVDDVFLDGQKLPRSNLSASSISLSALLDTGNSLLRGPSDVVQTITTALGGPHFACATPHTLAFQISGKTFPVDPRDFANPVFTDSATECEANLAPTDSPHEGKGYLYSWSLGDPFLKSVLASFYYGNLTYPSMDPPRVGLLSTVPADADQRMKDAAMSASADDGTFPATSQLAPTGTVTANADRVTDAASVRDQNGASRSASSGWAVGLATGLIVALLPS